VSNTTSNTISLTNPTTGLIVDSNIVVGGNVTAETIRSTNVYINNVKLLATTGLQQVTNVSNTTSNTISLTNPTTGLIVDSNIVVGGNVTAETIRSTNVYINNVKLLATTGLQQVTNVSNTTSNTISLTNPTTGLIVDSNIVVGGNVTAETIRSTNVYINNMRLLASTGLQQVTNVSNTTSNTLSLTNPILGLIVDSDVNIGGNISAGLFLGDGGLLSNVSSSYTNGNESYNQFGLSTSYSPGVSVNHNDYLNTEAIAYDNGSGSDISANVIVTPGFNKIKIELNASVVNITDTATEIVIALERSINGLNASDVKQFVFPPSNNFYGSQHFIYVDTHGASIGDSVEYKLRVDMSSYNNESARVQYGICGDCLYIKELK